MIKKGQIYESCDPREGASRRIRVEQYLPGSTRAQVVSHPDGKRYRQILVETLHQSAVTQAGERRRRGYALIGKVEST